jgi:hypothetical protein
MTNDEITILNITGVATRHPFGDLEKGFPMMTYQAILGKYPNVNEFEYDDFAGLAWITHGSTPREIFAELFTFTNVQR